MRASPTIFIVPTGIGCEIGGFAGDALPAAKLLASASGCLITHPNVMNGGSLSEVDDNIYYVEGYSLDRFAKCEISLRKVRQQNIGIIFDSSIGHETLVRHLQVVDACRATLGIQIGSYVITDSPIGVECCEYSSIMSSGIIKNPKPLIDAGKKLLEKGSTAIAIVADFPDQESKDNVDLYRKGKGVDFIAGVEAVISHLISKFLKVPCAHSPSLKPIGIEYELDPRAAAEEIGYTFLPSVLIGLSKAPDLIEIRDYSLPDDINPYQVETIVVPSGALGGESVLAFFERGLNVVAVRNMSSINVDHKYFNYPKLFQVDNYLEAAGLLLSLRKGINFESVIRPFNSINNSQI